MQLESFKNVKINTNDNGYRFDVGQLKKRHAHMQIVLLVSTSHMNAFYEQRVEF